jgi:hypothetical protein
VNTVGQGGWATVVGNVGSGLQVEYLVVAGGGGGTGGSGGGGGAGGFRTGTTAIEVGTSYAVIVGAGGVTSASGSDSVFGNSPSAITSAGGGASATGWNFNGSAGGSGGGGGPIESGNPNGLGGAGNTPNTSPSQGNNGGNGRVGSGNASSGDIYAGGGGGGSSAIGGNAMSTKGGDGGNGTESSISGVAVAYSGGGGAGADNFRRANSSGAGGSGGGGAGGDNGSGGSGSPEANGTSGTAHTGGGGGGGNNTGTGGAGGSGVVIIRAPQAASATTGSPTVTTDGSSTIYTFTGTGSITFGASSFAPLDISGLQLWLDASDNNTLYDATTGGSLVAADGAVARWEDKSGNNNHATEETNGPQLKTNILNSKSILRFDGNNDLIRLPQNFRWWSNGTIFAVLANDNNADAPWYTACLNYDNPEIRLFPQTHSGRWYWSGSYMLNDSPDHYNSIGTGSIRTIILNNTEYKSYSNGLLKNTTTFSSPVSANEPSTVHILGGFLPPNDGTALCVGIDIAEILIYNITLSNSERELVENYLMTKWGIN